MTNTFKPVFNQLQTEPLRFAWNYLKFGVVDQRFLSVFTSDGHCVKFVQKLVQEMNP